MSTTHNAGARKPAAKRNRPGTAQPRPTGPDTATTSPPAREERIRQAAYAFYEQRNQGDGLELDDWLKAEALIDEAQAGDAQATASAGSGH